MVDRLIQIADSSGEYETLLKTKRTKVEENRDRNEFLKRFSWVNNVTISTFHSLCYKLVKDWGTKGATNNFSDNRFRLLLDSKSADEEIKTQTADETRASLLSKILIEECKNKEFLLEFKKYLLDYLVDRIDINPKRRNSKYDTNYTSLNGTKVRSKSEQFIADWLYRHNVKFVYEPIVNMKSFDFKPDFYLPEANIYLEHISNLSSPMANKEKELFEGGKVLVKTYESDTKDTAFFNLVLDRAIKGKLPQDHNYNPDINYEEEFKYYHKEIKDFRSQVLRVMDMIKVENTNLAEISERAQKNAHERVRKFYEFAIPLIESYNAYCLNKSYLDFNDLIISSVDLMNNHESVRNSISGKYKYILVDEFQDVNNLQIDLLSLLLTDSTQLFCVGDDWQSIYGFRGSNVDYIVNFENYYPRSKTIKLEKNYRSTPNIVDASNEIIKNNKFQVDKNLEAFKKSNSAIHVHESSSEADSIAYVVTQVTKLIAQGYGKDDILFLYRRSKMYDPYFKAFKEQNIFVSNKTIHASKGLEAKAVFILGLTDGSGGFPDVWLSDAIFQVVKESDHELLLEEERRLFYVAVTRAKDHLFLIAQKDNPSRFIEEIPRKYKLENQLSKEKVNRIYQCVSCENMVRPSDKFCSSCGTSLVEVTSDNAAESKTKNKKGNWIKERAQKNFKNAYEPWTKENDKQLKELMLEGKTIVELANIMGRSTGAIQARLEKLNF
jgi:DNA helicase-4